MAGAELRQAQGQVPVALEAVVVDLDVGRAVHGLDGKDPLLGLGDEHVVAEFLPVAGALPEAAVDDLGGVDLQIAVPTQAVADVVLQKEVDGPALVVPEDHARGLVLGMEEVQGLAELAVVALLRLGQTVEIGLELLAVPPGGAVDALQHLVARVAAPVGSGHLHQLEAVAQFAGAGEMGAAADIEPFALAIDGDLFARGNDVLDDLDLVGLAQAGEQGLGLLPLPDLADQGQIPGDDLVHALLDGRQVLGGEGLRPGEVVIEAVVDGGTDGDLGAGIQFLHRLGHDVGGIMAQ